MKLGVWIPAYRKWVGRQAVLSFAQAAEGLGFASLYVIDHVVAPVGDREEAWVEPQVGDWLAVDDYGNTGFSAVEYYGEENWFLDPYIVWGFLAACTTTIELSSCVVVLPYRNPIVQAKMMGTLDVLSGGRMAFGLGIGHVESESVALGIPFSERGRRMDEYLDVIHALLTNDEVSFEGRYIEFGTVRPLIQPIQHPRPPFLIGGSSKAAARRAVDRGDEWFPAFVSPNDLDAGIRFLKEYAEAQQRPQPPVGVTLLWGLIDPDNTYEGTSRRGMMTVDEAAGKLAAFQELGVSRLAVDLPNPNLAVALRQFELLAEAANRADVPMLT